MTLNKAIAAKASGTTSTVIFVPRPVPTVPTPTSQPQPGVSRNVLFPTSTIGTSNTQPTANNSILIDASANLAARYIRQDIISNVSDEDAFDLVLHNKYNQESVYYLSLPLYRYESYPLFSSRVTISLVSISLFNIMPPLFKTYHRQWIESITSTFYLSPPKPTPMTLPSPSPPSFQPLLPTVYTKSWAVPHT